MRCRLGCYPCVHFHLGVGLTQVLQGRGLTPMPVLTRPAVGARR